MSLIDPTARVAGEADIATDAEIGPFCVIGPQVKIGSGVKLVSHVHIAGVTEIGANTVVHPFASLGGPPQSVHYHGEPTRLVIGANCQIREGVTANTGTVDGGDTEPAEFTVRRHAQSLIGMFVGYLSGIDLFDAFVWSEQRRPAGGHRQHFFGRA